MLDSKENRLESLSDILEIHIRWVCVLKVTIHSFFATFLHLDSNHKEPIRFPLNKLMAKELIEVTVIFNSSKDNLTLSWCDDIEVTVEVNDELLLL